MTGPFKQAARIAGLDGPVEVRRVKDSDTILLSVTHLNHTQHIELTEYNASRLCVLLAFMIGMPMASAVLKAVKL
jgi:hypothetical protein